jgi:hypothetical protein
MELSPSWEATSYAATQELTKTLWNTKFRHRVHKNTEPVPILRQINPVNTIRHYKSKIYLIIHPFTSLSS